MAVFSKSNDNSSNHKSLETKVEIELNAAYAGIKQFVYQNMPEHPLVENIENIVFKSSTIPLRIEIVFLSNFEENWSKYESFFNWLAIDNCVLELMNSKSGLIQRKITNNDFLIDLDLIHFRNLPIRKIGYKRPHLQLLLVDEWFLLLPDYQDVFEYVTIDRPLLVLSNLTEEAKIKDVKFQLYKKAINVSTINHADSNNLFSYIEQKGILDYKKSVHLHNLHVQFGHFYTLIEQYLLVKKNALESRVILSQQQLIQYKSDSKSLTSQDYSKLKVKIQKAVKRAIKRVEEESEQLVKHSSKIQIEINKSIEELPNVQIEEGVKYNTLKVKESYLDKINSDVVDKLSKSVYSLFTQSNQSIINLENEVKAELNSLSISNPIVVKKSFGQRDIKNAIDDEINSKEKKYEKQVMRKGFYHLLTEIRMPLFMMMPMMMIGGILYALIVGREQGEFHFEEVGGQKYLVITELIEERFKYIPEIYKNELNREYKSWITPGEGKPLFVIYKDEKVSTKFRSVYKVKLDINLKDEEQRKASNTPKIIRIPLFDPEYEAHIRKKLKSNEYNASLVSKKSTVGGGGMTGFINPLIDYNKIALPIIALLLTWFVTKKRKEFKLEQVETENKGKSELKNLVKQDYQRILKQSSKESSNGIIGYLIDFQNNFLQNIESLFIVALENKKAKSDENIASMTRAIAQLESKKRISEQKNKVFLTKKQKLIQMKPQFRILLKH
jgi:hypothetical protein